MYILQSNDKPVRSASLWPLRQLAELCKKSQTRYGYIQTDEEVVVCCFSKSIVDPGKLCVSVMPVPWARHGVHLLTVDLALWWLCMLAMSGEGREIVHEDELVKIDAWSVANGGEALSWVRRHRYSSREELIPPPPPPAYDTPSPNNPAALAAGVGLFAYDWFDHSQAADNAYGEHVDFEF